MRLNIVRIKELEKESEAVEREDSLSYLEGKVVTLRNGFKGIVVNEKILLKDADGIYLVNYKENLDNKYHRFLDIVCYYEIIKPSSIIDILNGKAKEALKLAGSRKEIDWGKVPKGTIFINSSGAENEFLLYEDRTETIIYYNVFSKTVEGICPEAELIIKDMKEEWYKTYEG